MDIDVVVVGSANLDLVVRLSRLPARGETVGGGRLTRTAGGKGLNQAVAAARLGARTAFVGAVGQDEAAALLERTLRDAGVDVDGLRRTRVPTGTAVVLVAEDGENQIVVVPGANHALPPPRELPAARVLLVQLEIPAAVVAEARERATAAGTLVVANLAPAEPEGVAACRGAHVVVANEAEALAVCGSASAGVLRASLGSAAAVVTRGAAGALVADGDGERLVPAPVVRAVDSVGAGDAFCGALAARLAANDGVVEAAGWAVAAGAAAVTRPGAADAMPTREDVRTLREETA